MSGVCYPAAPLRALVASQSLDFDNESHHDWIEEMNDGMWETLRYGWQDGVAAGCCGAIASSAAGWPGCQG
jgi:hypothetical protein